MRGREGGREGGRETKECWEETIDEVVMLVPITTQSDLNLFCHILASDLPCNLLSFFIHFISCQKKRSHV